MKVKYIQIQSIHILSSIICLSLMLSKQRAEQCDYEQPLSMISQIDPRNMSNLGCTYNIFKGNPFQSTDLQKMIFALQFDYSNKVSNNVQESSSSDNKWRISDGVSYNSLSSCFSKPHSEYIDSMDKLNNILKKRVVVEEGFPKGAFSQSYGIQKIQKGLSEQSSILVYSEQDCVVGEFRVQDTLSTHPLLDVKFVDALRLLENTQNDDDKFYRFFDQYGTHVITKIKKGSTARYEFEFSKSDMLELHNAGLSIEEGVTAYLNEIYFKRTFNTLSYFKFQEKENNSITKSQVLTMPTPLKQQFDVDWEKRVIKQPAKNIQVSLITFEKLLSRFTRRDTQGLTTNEIDNLRKGFKQYLETYCTDWLLPNKRVTSCEMSKASIPEFKIKKNSIIEKASTTKIPLVLKYNNLYFKVDQRDSKYLLISKQLPSTQIESKDYQFQLDRLDTNVYIIRNFVDLTKCVTLENCQSIKKSNNFILLPCEYQNSCQRFMIEASNNNSEFKIKNELTEKGLFISNDNQPILNQDENSQIIKIEESKYSK